jgi:very-short-patch-repair endonuclease
VGSDEQTRKKNNESKNVDTSLHLPVEEGLKKTGSFGRPQETTSPDRWRHFKDFARTHRKSPTESESILWDELRNKKLNGIKFRRQHAIDDYIVDFVSLEYRLVVEVDGLIHNFQKEYDEQRAEFLKWFGFAVIRFTNEEVEKDLDLVLESIKAAVEKRKLELRDEPAFVSSDPTEKGDASGLGTTDTENEHAPLDPTPDPSPDPSPTGRGGASGMAFHDRHGQTMVVDTTSPLPLGEGAGSDEQTHQKNNTASPKLTHPPGAANLLSRITNSRDYFLLWGPPGTGKTSVMLRDLTAWILNETGDNLLLLAYTNRAVDEICESLDSIGDDIRSQYLRIGARYSTEERFRGQLLNTKIAGVANRAALRQILEQHRIFVSTVASFSQNEGLLKLKKFQRLIVDEASQILEPQLIGLLTRFDHFVLIGDHRQLPAVTTQAAESTVVQDEALNGLGLYDLRDSYFERLYRRCMDRGWHWAYGQLDRQGRMHETIMDFPNRYFYEGKLQTLSPESAHHQKQSLAYKATANADTIGDVLCSHRVVFFPVNGEADSPGRKTSQPEAALAARIVAFFKNLWETNGKTWHPAKTLGIITPWRAQIAQIRESLTLAGIDPDTITIDTVERYQGGARDIIIVSTCVHSAHQLNSLVSMGDGGVDRKMNVALTRAREHLIMIGNEEILRSDARYRAFIEQYACR